MSYKIKIKRTISHTIILDVDAANEAEARDKAMEEVKTRPVSFAQLPPSTIIESDQIIAIAKY